MTLARVDTSAENGSVRIDLSGEIDLANVTAVEEEILAAVSGQFTAVSVDLTNLTYMDSVGIKLLFDLVSNLEKLHIAPVFITPFGSPTHRLIKLSGLESFVTVHPGS